MRRSLPLLACLALSHGAGAESFPRGEVTDPVATRHDPSQTYALYLPSAYTRERRWPIVFVLDPRSRGRMAAELFRDGAERFGYLLVSSNSTRSDVLPEDDPNPEAMVALLRDAMDRFAADERRVYLAGFSGTARYAWSVGFGLRGKVAGVIGCGGALPGPLEQWGDVGFAFFGAAGASDFNHREMWLLDEALDGTAVRHRVEVFDGGHAWAPPGLLAEALGWLELVAMRAGTREPDAALVAELWAAGAAEASRLEAEGEPYRAWRRWRQLAEDFDGLADTAPARRGAVRLGARPEVARDDAATREAARSEEAYRRRVDEVLAQLATRTPPPRLRQLAARLELPRLHERAAGASIQAQSARRQLEIAFVHAAFYAPRRMEREGDGARALLSLQLAAEIKPDHWRPWIALAAGHARAGRRAKAIAALEHAVDLGYSDLAALEGDPGLDAIRDEPGYRRIVERLRSARDGAEGL